MIQDYRFAHRLRVRYSEIDGQKIVFNAHYSTYIDIATTEYFRTMLGDHLIELAETHTFDPVLKKITIEFIKPAKLDDFLDIHCRVVKLGTSSFQLKHMITRGDENLVEAEVIQVNYDTASGKAIPIPDDLKKKILLFENQSAH